jgi:tetratricopeptide (TPR) repeat protein
MRKRSKNERALRRLLDFIESRALSTIHWRWIRAPFAWEASLWKELRFFFLSCVRAGFVALSLVLVGCASLQVGSAIQRGRAELMSGDPKAALVHFQRAAELDPGYVLNFTHLHQGVWTYVGRAYYMLGSFPQAREALQRARSLHPQDRMGQLYLGLTLARQGATREATREMEAGLRGLDAWLEHLDQNHPDGQFWDPGRDLRKSIQEQLATLSKKEFEWPRLISSAESLGMRLEREIEFARLQKAEELYKRDGDGSTGR